MNKSETEVICYDYIQQLSKIIFINIGGCDDKFVDHFRDLGVKMKKKNTICFDQHINTKCEIASAKLKFSK